MNYTYYFYCECEYEKVVHEKENELILQCNCCFTIQSKDKKLSYFLSCLGCGEKKKIGNTVTFEEELLETCEKCGLSGSIGLEKGEEILFLLGSGYEEVGNCDSCKQNDWKVINESDVTCPHCFKNLKQKMSIYWEK